MVTGAVAALRGLDDGRYRAEFYRMWRSAYAAGFPHPKALETIGPRQTPGAESVRLWLLEGTTRGQSVAELVRKGGRRFEVFEVALLTLGEESGRFEDALRLLGDFYSRKYRLMLWVKKKMAYPFFTALFACLIAPLQLLFLGHERLYFALAGSGVLTIVLGSGAIVAAVSEHYGRKPAMVRARMARALATAIEAGLPLPRAIRLAADASADKAVMAFVTQQRHLSLATQSIGASLAGCPHLTPDFVAILATAERTGDF